MERRASATPARALRKSNLPGHLTQGSPQTPVSSAPSPAVSRSKGRRIVRKRSLWERMRALPENMLSDWLEDLALLDWRPLGYPTGLGLNALHALTRLATWRPHIRIWRNSVTEEHLKAAARSTRWIGMRWSSFISICFFGVSLANALYVLNQRRKYELWMRKPQDALSTPSARAVDADLFAPEKPWRTWLWDWLTSLILSPKPGEMGQVIQLSIWTPDELNLRIFMLYSPVTALLWHLMTSSSALLYLFAMLCVGGQTWYLVHLYEQTLKDRLLLHAEVASEYHTKFVQPRLFAYKKDASTQTSQAEMIHTTFDADGHRSSPRQKHSDVHERRRSRRSGY